MISKGKSSKNLWNNRFGCRHRQVSRQVNRRGILAWLNHQLREAASRLSVEGKFTAEDDPTLDLLTLCATYVENDAEVALAFVDGQHAEPLLTILNACQVTEAVCTVSIFTPFV